MKGRRYLRPKTPTDPYAAEPDPVFNEGPEISPAKGARIGAERTPPT